MAENNKILSVVVTNANKLPDLSIKEAQLIFISDMRKIALDLNGKRTFYNEIVMLQTEQERMSLTPIVDLYYFVIETTVLWVYRSTGWVQLTSKPEEIIYIGASLPELGSENKLYVDKNEKTISIWDNETQKFEPVSDYTKSIEENEIINLFN